MATKVGAYTEQDIKNLQFPESIRKRPTLFIGPTDERGVLHIYKEVLDNVVDEALAGRATVCSLYIAKNEFWVMDNGEGVPTGNIAYKDITGKTHKVSAFKAAFAIPDTSGKYQGDAYGASRGTHGLGAKATNALSTEFEAWTCRDGKWFHMLYKKGVEVEAVSQIKKAPTFPPASAPMKRGTLIRFVPDPKIFTSLNLSLKKLDEWATIAAFFTPKFKVNLILANGKKKQYYFPNGPIDYITAQVEKLKAEPLSSKVFIVAGDKTVDCVVQFTNHDKCEFHGFTNGLRNPEEGVHVSAFYKALFASLQQHVKRGQKFKADDLKDGLVGIVNAKLSHPMFDSQTKEKLVDERANKPLLVLLTKELTAFFAKHKSLAIAVIDQAVKLRDLHNKFKLSKTATRDIKKLMKTGFPSTAIIAPNVPAHQRELILLEGESAKGSASLARLPHQEILPLKGKILNAQRKRDSQVFASKEVVNILAMIGFNPDAEDPLAKMRVGKIIFMSDPDPDGPLHGDTQVRVVYEQEEHLVTMHELSIMPWVNRQYKVRTWDGKSAVMSEAHGCRVTTVSDKEVMMLLDDDTKIRCAPNHQWCLYSLKSDDRTVATLNVGLHCIQAHRLKVGDRLARLVDMGQGKGIKLVESRIVKLKDRSCEPTSYYCLTVPAYHNFALANGTISKNCHINSLLMTLFAKYMPTLYERKLIYVSMMPQFYSYHAPSGRLFTGTTAKEAVEKAAEAKLKLAANHIKGLGEVNPSLLKKLAFDPESRILAEVRPWKNAKDKDEFVLIMGDSVEGRRKLLDL